MREHDARYDDLWLVIVMVDPDGPVELVVGNAAEVDVTGYIARFLLAPL
jgi:hypothetical protein